nr:hypothetical protein TDPV-345 [Oriental turtle dovepox virus]
MKKLVTNTIQTKIIEGNKTYRNIKNECYKELVSMSEVYIEKQVHIDYFLANKSVHERYLHEKLYNYKNNYVNFGTMLDVVLSESIKRKKLLLKIHKYLDYRNLWKTLPYDVKNIIFDNLSINDLKKIALILKNKQSG